MQKYINDKILKEIKQYLIKLNENLKIVVFELHQNMFTQNTIDLLEGLVYCLKGIEFTKATHNIDIEEDFFKEKIQEIKQAIQDKEYNMAGDIIEYEVSELILRLSENLKNV